MDGALAFERGKHDAGLKSLSVAFEVLGRLAATAGSATDEALANEMMDEVEPMLRFCAYKLGKDTAAGVAPIAKEVAEEQMSTAVPGWDELSQRLERDGKQGKKESVEISWRGETIPVRNAELVAAAIKVRDALATLRQDQTTARKAEVAQGKQKEGKKEILGTKRMGTYDKALLVLGEAESIASQLIEDNKVRSRDSTGFGPPLTVFVRRSPAARATLFASRLRRALSRSSTPTSSTTFSQFASSATSSSSRPPRRSLRRARPRFATSSRRTSLGMRPATRLSQMARSAGCAPRLIRASSRCSTRSC